MTINELQILAGKPYPLGATKLKDGVNFALFSSNAKRVELCLFDDEGSIEIARIPVHYKTGHIWHCAIPAADSGQRYGFRVYGDYNPRVGHRFNGNKLLIDPYARLLDREVEWDDVLFERPDSSSGILFPDFRDSQSIVPKGIVIDNEFDWQGDLRPTVSVKETIIYEVHPKGFTQNHPDVPEAHRGKYLGLIAPTVIQYLKSLGVTTIELMPCQAFADEPMLTDKGLVNYWGYNTISFFAPSRRYAVDDPVQEFKTMIRELHKAGFEVIIDVVYNHTAEGNGGGPVLSFKGIDNAVYYKLVDGNAAEYMNYSGCGNTINAEHPQVLKLIADSLRYWVEEMHVDGFRFDLAPILGREYGRFTPHSAFFDVIYQDPILSQVKMIAEPWDIGPDGYQVGNFPIGWREWNDKFRDTVRAFWRGEGGMIGELAERISGSSDLYRHNGRRPTATVNFVTAHDGFSLHDLVSYQEKHNEANLENNRDGHSHNISWNCGIEGETEDAAINQLRLRQKKNILATLFLSQGIPMLLAGDEIGRTQGGNNNAYCQDNDINWLNWHVSTDNQELLHFTKTIIALRKQHAVFCRHEFLDGIHQRGAKYKDVTWLHAEGREMSTHDWGNWNHKALGILLAGDSLPDIDERGKAVHDNNFLFIMNAHHEEIAFILPNTHKGTLWEQLFDTNKSAKDNSILCKSGDAIKLQAHSCCLFIEQQ